MIFYNTSQIWYIIYMKFNKEKKIVLPDHIIDGGDFFYIKLTKNKRAKISKKDVHLVVGYKWQYRSSGKTNGKNGYAQNNHFFMHNLIIKSKKDMVVDHINRDGLDNRRENLRLVSRSENAHNVIRKNKNGYRGVNFKKNLKIKPYVAQIKKDHKVIHIGCYRTPKEAGMAYNKKAKELFGDVAVLNKI